VKAGGRNDIIAGAAAPNLFAPLREKQRRPEAVTT
jgi:hypothetical protein